MIARNKESGDFEIFEDDVWPNPNDDIRTITGALDAEGKLVGVWKITADDLEETDDYDDFYFTVDGETVETPLEINLTRKDDPMTLEVKSPACGSYFNESEEVKIEIRANDKDDLIEGTVKIENTVIANITNGVTKFNYTFDGPGNITLVAEAVDFNIVRTDFF